MSSIEYSGKKNLRHDLIKSGHSSNNVVPFLWVVFSSVCLIYGILGFEYFFSFGTERQGLWSMVLSFLVSEEFATGAGSVHSDQIIPYSKGYSFLLTHTMFGGICLAIGPFQFMGSFRRKYTKLHRNMGKVYLISVMISMVAGIAYLVTTPMGQVFSGKPFSVGLMALDLMVLLTAWLAYSAIRKRRVVQHQAWMAFNFALIFATPTLRIFWIVFGWSMPQFTQAQLNTGVMTYLLPFSLLGSMIWYSLQHSRAKFSHKGRAQ